MAEKEPQNRIEKFERLTDLRQRLHNSNVKVQFFSGEIASDLVTRVEKKSVEDDGKNAGIYHMLFRYTDGGFPVETRVDFVCAPGYEDFWDNTAIVDTFVLGSDEDVPLDELPSSRKVVLGVDAVLAVDDLIIIQGNTNGVVIKREGVRDFFTRR